MEDIRSIVARLPRRELEIRRRCAQDPGFRAICRDYEEAAAALCRWRGVAEERDRRVQEYANFVGELEAEILACLDRPD
jgi:hypothetical protein